MKVFKKIGFVLLGSAVVFGVAASINLSHALETKAADEVYTYATGDGTWITENTVRSYETTNFTLIHRKNSSSSNVATTYAELRVYASHSMEITPKVSGERYVTGVEVTATTAAYATAMGNASVLAGTSEATAIARTGLSSVSGSVATFNLVSVTSCEFVKFTLAAQSRTVSWKIIYSLADAPVVNVTGVTVTPSSHTMAASETHLPTATVAPANATNQTVSWESDDPDVASVDPVTGLVTGVSEGTATVTATTEDGGFMDTIDYTITAGPFYTHQFASGEFGANSTYVDIRGAQVTLDSINWSLSASYYPDWTDQNAYLGFITNRGLQVGSGDKAPYEFGLRSALTSHKVIKVIVKAGAASNIIDGYLSVSVGGVDLGSPQALSTSTVTPEVTFQSETPLFGHIQITYTQSNDGTVAGSKAFYIDKVTIYGETDANISSASAFANDLESFDSCGVGSEYSSLESGYEALSSTAKGHLSSILLDDKNGVGQTAGTTIQRDIISASDKWDYVTMKFGGDYGSQETLIDSSKSILSIVAISIIGLSTILGYHFISKKKEA